MSADEIVKIIDALSPIIFCAGILLFIMYVIKKNLKQRPPP